MARMERFHGRANICATSAARMAVLNVSKSVMSDKDSPVLRMPSESARVKYCGGLRQLLSLSAGS